MNELNYASLEASKRLVEAGIVLETDFHWYKSPISSKEWRLLATKELFQRMKESAYPAPSMAEVWRELPSPHNDMFLVIGKDENILTVYYELPDQYGDGGTIKASFTSTNSTDALIDLLIWVRKERI